MYAFVEKCSALSRKREKERNHSNEKPFKSDAWQTLHWSDYTHEKKVAIEKRKKRVQSSYRKGTGKKRSGCNVQRDWNNTDSLIYLLLICCDVLSCNFPMYFVDVIRMRELVCLFGAFFRSLYNFLLSPFISEHFSRFSFYYDFDGEMCWFVVTRAWARKSWTYGPKWVTKKKLFGYPLCVFISSVLRWFGLHTEKKDTNFFFIECR